jgi:hypothetical protein
MRRTLGVRPAISRLGEKKKQQKHNKNQNLSIQILQTISPTIGKAVKNGIGHSPGTTVGNENEGGEMFGTSGDHKSYGITTKKQPFGRKLYGNSA